MKMLKFNKNGKKWMLSIILIVGAFVAAKSQSNLLIGVRTGVVAGWYTGLDNVRPHAGFTGGLFVQYKPWNNWGISGDIMYAHKGTWYDLNLTGVPPAKGHLDMKYIDVPVMATYYFGDGTAKIKPRIMLGPSISFLVASDYHQPMSAAPRGSFKELDYGAVAGTGINMHLNNRTWFTADLRYNYSFTKVYEGGDMSDFPVINRNLSLTVGLGINIGKVNNSN